MQVVIVIVHGVIIVLLVILNFKMVIIVAVVLTKETTVLITINGSCIFCCKSTQLVEAGLLLDQLHLGSCAKRDRNKRTWELPQKIQL